MACYKLTSCTAGNNTVIYTNSNLVAYVGLSIEIVSNPGVCFTVEVSDPPCNCIAPIAVTVSLPDCICTTSYNCYILSECNNLIAPFYVSTNLNPYVGTTISVAEFPGYCFNVTGVTDSVQCANAVPPPTTVTCAEPCVCGPVIYCYELTNCLNPLQIIQINTTLILTLNNVIQPTPAIIPPGGNNCWTVTGEGITPCNAGVGTTVTAVVDYGPDGCVACAGPPDCYQLTSCDGLTTVYTQSNLAAYVGGPPIATTVFPGECWVVSLVPQGEVCPGPVVIEPISISFCICPCYTLTNCRTQVVIISNSNLAAYVGQSVHLDPPDDIGCSGDCWLVAVNNGPCPAPRMVTVSVGCTPCGPCNETCYELVDCETDVVFLVALNPTVNAVDLSTLISGQAIGQIISGGVTYNGCWYVRLAQDCASAVDVSVSNIYQPTVQQSGCEQCMNSCYGLLNCETLTIDYVIKYTVPNPYSLPNPATLTGAIGSLCFEDPVGCVPGCYQLQLIPGVSCVGSVDWSTVVSLTAYQDCFSCQPPCYLLTECAPVVSVPFVVNNDLSLYVGQVAKICDAQGICHCYYVEIAQDCENAITIDNANASFITCEECNSCDCPPGYTRIGDNCQKITSVPAIANPTIYSTGPGSINAQYGSLGTNFYSNISALPFPLTAVTGPDRFVDAALVNVPFVNNTIGVWGGPAGSRLNTIGVWTTVPPNPISEWIGFTECIDIPVDGTYCIGIGGDDTVRMKIDGVLVALATIGFFDFNYWHVFEINLTAGTHVITLEGNNSGTAAAFAAEIYNTTSAILQTYTTAAQVQAITIFSTFPKRTSGTFQTGEDSGYSCPPGYALNTCNGAPVCSLIETIPFVECAPTYLVTDCSGSQISFYTNTDLSAYLGSSFKTCIPSITYSNTCFILKDCNRLSADIVTNTDLTIYLWQIVNVQGYPGSCFIVTGVPVGDPCVNPIPVVATPPLVDACNCPGAQQPWPAGCYCVTVQQVIPPIVATDFEGVFDSTPYDCCESCSQVCYLLTSCTPGIDPVIVCNDLSLYVGVVIKIESCGDICWQVELSQTCSGSITFAGNIISFEDCADCLPPPPPTPPPFDLHLRKIKPGYKSPNSCYTLEYIEKVNCTFAQQVYNAMLVQRYGLTMCCEEDLNVWDIKKQLLDLDMMKDPSLCKSTLCCCPAPCLIDVVITVLPFCGNPNIISVILDLPCDPPVIIDVDITVEVIPAPCYCWHVTATITQIPFTYSYLDCCCIIQTIVIDTLGDVDFAICAVTEPVSFSVDPLVADNVGLCGEALLCNPPPPQECLCWKIENLGMQVEGYVVDQVCPYIGLGTIGTLPPGAPPIYICSIASPTGTPGLTITSMGPCDGYCGPIPVACVCYHLTSDTGTCQFSYTDCNGVPQVVVPTAPVDIYLCSQTVPTYDNIGCIMTNFNMVATPFNCVDGLCGPPFPCDCYVITVNDTQGLGLTFWYYDCNGVQQFETLSNGVYYRCGSNFGTLSPEINFATTPADCGLGECVDPYLVCICYEVEILPSGSPTQEITYTDCQGVVQNEILAVGTYYRCASTIIDSVPPASPFVTVSSTPLNCSLGECQAP